VVRTELSEEEVGSGGSKSGQKQNQVKAHISPHPLHRRRYSDSSLGHLMSHSHHQGEAKKSSCRFESSPIPLLPLFYLLTPPSTFPLPFPSFCPYLSLCQEMMTLLVHPVIIPLISSQGMQDSKPINQSKLLIPLSTMPMFIKP
jgi:hypothetical protein